MLVSEGVLRAAYSWFFHYSHAPVFSETSLAEKGAEGRCVWCSCRSGDEIIINQSLIIFCGVSVPLCPPCLGVLPLCSHPHPPTSHSGSAVGRKVLRIRVR